MGLANDLGYTVESPNALQRSMQAFGATRAGAWFFSGREIRIFVLEPR